MKIIFATEGTNDQSDALNKCGAKNRLISFYYVKDKREGFIKDYVTRGHGRYIDEEAEKVKKMSDREFFDYFLSEHDLIEKEEI